LIIGANKLSANILEQQLFSNKLTVTFYVFCPLMKHKVGSNVKSCLIITIHFHWLNFTKLQFLEKLFYLHKFTS